MSDPQRDTKIEWRIEFETGDPSIDHEHREMIGRINEFLISAETEPDIDLTLKQLGDIYAWISAHFALEEKIMRNQNDKEYPPHKDDHEKLLDDLRDIMDEIEKAGTVGDLNQIQHRMSGWFFNHFKTLDARLHSALAAKP